MFVSQYWELNPDPLEELPVLFAASYLSSPALLFLKLDPPNPTHLLLTLELWNWLSVPIPFLFSYTRD